MSLSSNLKTLQSMARSLDYLHNMLSFEDISLEDYIFVTDILNRMSDLHKLLEGRNIVLEITEDERGVPLGHRLVVDKPNGGRLGVTTLWSAKPKQEIAKDAVWLGYTFDKSKFKDLDNDIPVDGPRNAREAGLES